MVNLTFEEFAEEQIWNSLADPTSVVSVGRFFQYMSKLGENNKMSILPYWQRKH
jgi:hypothetical protein